MAEKQRELELLSIDETALLNQAWTQVNHVLMSRTSPKDRFMLMTMNNQVSAIPSSITYGDRVYNALVQRYEEAGCQVTYDGPKSRITTHGAVDMGAFFKIEPGQSRISDSGTNWRFD